MRVMRASSRPEVKYLDITGTNLPMSVNNTTQTGGALRGSTCNGTNAGVGNKVYSNIFRAIVQGVSANQRVGNKVFVKSINTIVSYKYCPPAAWRADFWATHAQYVPDAANMVVRLVWSDDPSDVTADTTNYFANTGIADYEYFTPSVKRLNRRRFKFWADKTFRTTKPQVPMVTPNVEVYNNTLIEGSRNWYPFAPAEVFSHTLKVNKTITYHSVDTLPKANSENIYSLALFASPPALCGETGLDIIDLRKQYYCYTVNMRIYYTDV